MAEQRHDAAYVVGAVLGGVAGATYALLRAPQSGERTRARLVEYAQAAVYRVEEAADRVADGVGRLGGATRRSAARAGSTVRGLSARRPGLPAALGRNRAPVVPASAPTGPADVPAPAGPAGPVRATGPAEVELPLRRPAPPADPEREWPTPGQAVAAVHGQLGTDIVVDGPHPRGTAGIAGG